MRAAIILILCICILPFGGKGQVDSVLNKADSLRKGFYKTYQEYLADSPSVITDFTVKLYSASKDEPKIVSADYILADPNFNTGEIWGFCDGQDVFVASGSFFVLKYWKLQCRGPNPYLFYAEKKFLVPFTIGAIFASGLSFALPPNYQLMLIDKTGRPRLANDYYVKRVLRDDPALFKKFRKEYHDSDEIIMKYLREYNENYQHKIHK